MQSGDFFFGTGKKTLYVLSQLAGRHLIAAQRWLAAIIHA